MEQPRDSGMDEKMTEEHMTRYLNGEVGNMVGELKCKYLGE